MLCDNAMAMKGMFDIRLFFGYRISVINEAAI